MFWYILLAFLVSLLVLRASSEDSVLLPAFIIMIISALMMLAISFEQLDENRKLDRAQARCEVLKAEEVCNEYEVQKRTFVDYFEWPIKCNKGDNQ